MQCVIIKLSFDSIWRYDLLTEMSKILIVEVEKHRITDNCISK